MMSEEEKAEFTKIFIEDPYIIYDSPETLSGEQKADLFRLEESFAKLLYLQNRESIKKSKSKFSEEDIAHIVDCVGSEGEGLTELISEVQQICSAVRIMGNKAIQNVPVPEVLLNLIETSKSKKKKENIPAVILQFTADSIDIIKSTLKGVYHVPHTFAHTRAASAASAEKSSRVELQQNVSDELKLEYQIVRESVSELMVSMRFVKKPTGRYRINLLQDERIIASQMLSENEDSVAFSRLSVGSYVIDIDGPIEHQFSILIAEESSSAPIR